MAAELFLFGVAISVAPIPLLAYLVLFSAERGSAKAWAFIAGWVLSLVLICAATVTLTGGRPPRAGTSPSTALAVAKLCLGILLLWVAYRQWRRLGGPITVPKWHDKINEMSVLSAALLGFLLQPWPLVAAAALDVAKADLSKFSTILTLVIFIIIASWSYLAIAIYAIVAPVSAKQTLDQIQEFFNRHMNGAIMLLAASAGCYLACANVLVLIP